MSHDKSLKKALSNQFSSRRLELIRFIEFICYRIHSNSLHLYIPSTFNIGIFHVDVNPLQPVNCNADSDIYHFATKLSTIFHHTTYEFSYMDFDIPLFDAFINKIKNGNNKNIIYKTKLSINIGKNLCGNKEKVEIFFRRLMLKYFTIWSF